MGLYPVNLKCVYTEHVLVKQLICKDKVMYCYKRTVGQKNISSRERELNSNSKTSFIMWILYTFGIEEETSEMLRLEHSFIWC